MRIAKFPLIGRVVSKWEARKFRDAIICNHCLRRTRLVKSRYAPEKRYCEHCARELDNTNDPGKIVLTFGKVTLAPQGKMFLLADGDFEEFDQAKMALDVTDMYIDAATYSPLLLEKCLSHLFNYPPAHGVKAIRVFHTGSLDDLNPNIKALLKHHFTHIKPVNERDSEISPQQTDDVKPTFMYCTEHPNHAYFPSKTGCPLCEWFALPARTQTLLKQLADLKKEYLGIYHLNEAADSLGELRDVRAVDGLIAALKLKHYQNDRSSKVVDALVKIGSPAVDALITALKDKNEHVQTAAAHALGNIHDTRAVDALIATLKDKNEHVRGAAAYALGNIHDPRAVDALIATLKDTDRYVHKSAAVALGMFGDKRAVEPLLKILKDWDAIDVVHALGETRDDRAIDSLMSILEEETLKLIKDLPYRRPLSDVGIAARDALIKIGSPAVKLHIFSMMANSSNEGLRSVMAIFLERFLQWKAADDYEKAVYFVATWKWDECVKLGSSAVDPLIRVLKDDATFSQEGAARALGDIGDPRAIPELTKLTQKTQVRSVQQTAKVAIEKIRQAQEQKE